MYGCFSPECQHHLLNGFVCDGKLANGGTLCTIDPVQRECADRSQEWLRPWPSSDSALALGMLKVIIDVGHEGDGVYDIAALPTS